MELNGFWARHQQKRFKWLYDIWTISSRDFIQIEKSCSFAIRICNDLLLAMRIEIGVVSDDHIPSRILVGQTVKCNKHSSIPLLSRNGRHVSACITSLSDRIITPADYHSLTGYPLQWHSTQHFAGNWKCLHTILALSSTIQVTANVALVACFPPIILLLCFQFFTHRLRTTFQHFNGHLVRNGFDVGRKNHDSIGGLFGQRC